MLGRLPVILFASGILAGLCLAQTDNGVNSSTSAAPPSPTSAVSPTPAPEKVWTNDELASGKACPFVQ